MLIYLKWNDVFAKGVNKSLFLLRSNGSRCYVTFEFNLMMIKPTDARRQGVASPESQS